MIALIMALTANDMANLCENATTDLAIQECVIAGFLPCIPNQPYVTFTVAECKTINERKKL